VRKTSNGLFVKTIKNLRVQLIRKQLPPRYEISKVGAYRVAPGSQVHFAERYLFQQQDNVNPLIRLHFTASNGLSLAALGHSANFGPKPLSFESELAIGRPAIQVVPISDPQNQQGCEPYSLSSTDNSTQSIDYRKAVLVKRGGCTFSRKATMATQAGAKAALVINTDEIMFTPTADEADLKVEGASTIPLLLLGSSSGTTVAQLVLNGKTYLQVVGAVPQAGEQSEEGVFMINGLAIANAKYAGKPIV
jgi:mannosidase alpha-like ER degradation enhancer 1